MMQSLFRKSLMLGSAALVSAALSFSASAADDGMAKNPCAKPGNPCETKAANPCANDMKHKKMKKKAGNPCAKNPCEANPANPCAKK